MPARCEVPADQRRANRVPHVVDLLPRRDVVLFAAEQEHRAGNAAQAHGLARDLQLALEQLVPDEQVLHGPQVQLARQVDRVEVPVVEVTELVEVLAVVHVPVDLEVLGHVGGRVASRWTP